MMFTLSVFLKPVYVSLKVNLFSSISMQLLMLSEFLDEFSNWI